MKHLHSKVPAAGGHGGDVERRVELDRAVERTTEQSAEMGIERILVDA